MAHWAKIENDVVVQVTVGNNEDFDEGLDWLERRLGGTWVKTSYNTKGGTHFDPETGEPSLDQTKALRYNYAGKGFTYSNDEKWSSQGGAFIPPQPFPSWTLSEQTALWEPPTPYPVEEGYWVWDEQTLSWVERENLQ